jgi:hypothetical protein
MQVCRAISQGLEVGPGDANDRGKHGRRRNNAGKATSKPLAMKMRRQPRESANRVSSKLMPASSISANFKSKSILVS